MSRLLPLLRRVRRRLLVHRRLLAALLAGAAVLVGLQAVAPPPPETTLVWTAAADLSPGHVIARPDLRRVAFSPGSAPAEVAGPADLVGRTVAAPVVRGAPLSPASVVGEDLARGYPDRVAVPVRITDPDVAALLRVGDRIDVVAASAETPGRARTVATGAYVLTLPAVRSAPASSSMSGALALLAVTSEEVEALVAAGVSAYVSVIWSH